MKLHEISLADKYANVNTELSKDEVIKLLRGEYSDAWKAHLNKSTMYRGLDGISYDIAESSAHEIVRKSAQMETNHYTELFSNYLSTWKKYPKRNQSIICTTDIPVAKGWATRFGAGKTFAVFPKNGTKIGVAPAGDFWYSFKHGLAYLNVNEIFNKLGAALGIKYQQESKMQTMAAFNRYLDDILKESKKTIKQALAAKIGDQTFERILNINFSPELNDFSIVEEIPSGKLYETWFSNKCLLINIELIDSHELLKKYYEIE